MGQSDNLLKVNASQDNHRRHADRKDSEDGDLIQNG